MEEIKSMKIDKLTFLNFRCFENYQLSLKRGVNLLFGSNSSGKTTILRGLKIAMSSFFSGFSDANTRFLGISDADFMSNVNLDIESLERPVTIEYDLSDFKNLQNQTIFVLFCVSPLGEIVIFYPFRKDQINFSILSS